MRRLLGVEPNGQHITLEGITLSQFENGKLIEELSHWDTFGYLQQLGWCGPRQPTARDSGASEMPETSQA